MPSHRHDLEMRADEYNETFFFNLQNRGTLLHYQKSMIIFKIKLDSPSKRTHLLVTTTTFIISSTDIRHRGKLMRSRLNIKHGDENDEGGKKHATCQWVPNQHVRRATSDQGIPPRTWPGRSDSLAYSRLTFVASFICRPCENLGFRKKATKRGEILTIQLDQLDGMKVGRPMEARLIRLNKNNTSTSM